MIQDDYNGQKPKKYYNQSIEEDEEVQNDANNMENDTGNDYDTEDKEMEEGEEQKVIEGNDTSGLNLLSLVFSILLLPLLQPQGCPCQPLHNPSPKQPCLP